MRNVLIAIGNSADAALLPAVEARLADPDPLIRGAAVWASRRLATEARGQALRLEFSDKERDTTVQAEWNAVVPAGAR